MILKLTSDDLDDLSPDRAEWEDLTLHWVTHLRNARKSPRTIRSYTDGLKQYADWCEARGKPLELTKRAAEAFTASILAQGKSASTATARQVALRQFGVWLLDEGEIKNNELERLRAPRGDSRMVTHLAGPEMNALLAACRGRGFSALRDLAMIRVMAVTGARCDEMTAMKTWDVQLGAGSLTIVRGKGGRGRRSGFGSVTGEAIGRYMRVRKRYLGGVGGREVPELWLTMSGSRSRGMSYAALYKQLKRRAAIAGVEDFHPHRLRHTAAVNWLRSGGSINGLMSQCGWTSAGMVRRYVAAAEAELAIEESHRLALDEF